MNSEVIFAKRYLKMGAMGYISKDAPLSEIIKAIENILHEGSYLSNNMKEKLAMDELEGNNNENQFENLSPREFEIAQHLVQGESVSAISKKLNLHTSTIGTHKARIFEKLKCQNIIELVMLAKMNNIIM
jgi:two-component system invasion response regulator UvrY